MQSTDQASPARSRRLLIALAVVLAAIIAIFTYLELVKPHVAKQPKAKIQTDFSVQASSLTCDQSKPAHCSGSLILGFQSGAGSTVATVDDQTKVRYEKKADAADAGAFKQGLPLRITFEPATTAIREAIILE